MPPLSDVLSDANSLKRISIQVTKSQYELLKEYARPGTSISSMIRRAIDDMFQPVIEQRLEEMKNVIPEAPEMELWKDLQPKETANAAS
tara:strand:- start:1208 stop:1474 length:267 start_codon:yes stop_codon:yes gene_type:complete